MDEIFRIEFERSIRRLGSVTKAARFVRFGPRARKNHLTKNSHQRRNSGSSEDEEDELHGEDSSQDEEESEEQESHDEIE